MREISVFRTYLQEIIITERVALELNTIYFLLTLPTFYITYRIGIPRRGAEICITYSKIEDIYSIVKNTPLFVQKKRRKYYSYRRRYMRKKMVIKFFFQRSRNSLKLLFNIVAFGVGK